MWAPYQRATTLYMSCIQYQTYWGHTSDGHRVLYEDLPAKALLQDFCVSGVPENSDCSSHG